MRLSRHNAAMTPSQVLAIILLGCQSVTAEIPPNKELCYDVVHTKGSGSPDVAGCKETTYYCAEKGNAKWTDWKLEFGPKAIVPPDGASLGSGKTYTTTSGVLQGLDAGVSLGSFGELIKRVKGLESFSVSGGYSRLSSHSTSSTETAISSLNCPPNIICGLVVREHQLVVTGWRYHHVQGGLMSNCEKAKPSKPFKVHYPILTAESNNNAADIELKLCYDGTNTGGLTQKCPQVEWVDPKPDGPNPDKAPPGMGCRVDGRNGKCQPAGACRAEGKEPLEGKKNPSGKWPCGEEKDVECCVDRGKPEGDDSGGDDGRCNVDGRDGQCKDANDCLGEGKQPLEGEESPDGKWPCFGGKNIQCCTKRVPGDPEQPPAGKEECEVDGRNGDCKNANACRGEGKEPLYGKKGADGKYPCSGGRDNQCCIPKKTPSRPPKCRVGEKTGLCMPVADCSEKPMEGKKNKHGKWPCEGGKDIQCCPTAWV